MDKRFQKIYIWSFIMVAGFVLLLLYTPLGGRLYYVADEQNYSLQPGVDFGQKISNAPRISSYNSGGGSSGVNVSSYSYGSSGYSSRGGGDATSFLQSTSGSMNVSETSNAINSYGGQGGSSGADVSSGGGGGGSQGGSGAGGGFSTAAPSVDLATITENLGLPSKEDDITKAGEGTMDDGATDPGGDPDPGTMIPVGGNIFYLIFMLLPYIAFKRFKLKSVKK